MTNYQFLTPYRFNNGLELKNRVVMAPTTTMSSFYNGMVTKDELAYYAKRADGPGMIVTEVANVSTNGKGFEGELSVTSDDMIPGLTKLAKTIQKDGAKAILQIFHAGRKSFKKILAGETPVGPSATKAIFPPNSEVPRELTEAEIEQIIVDFGQATRRAIVAGFDGVELHGANTYLLQQFYSPNANLRTDAWGGDRDGRLSFAKKVLAEVNRVITKYGKDTFLLGYRLSPEEIETPGIRLADSLYFVSAIKDDVDYIHLSMGSYKRTSLNDRDDKTLLLHHFSNILSQQIPLIGIGSIETPQDAEEALSNGASLIAIGRELIREPEWVQKVASGNEASIRQTLDPKEMDDLAIPAVMQSFLTGAFFDVMHFTTDEAVVKSYTNELAPMEGVEKKL